jgi:hypothetical protein
VDVMELMGMGRMDEKMAQVSASVWMRFLLPVRKMTTIQMVLLQVTLRLHLRRMVQGISSSSSEILGCGQSQH